MKEEWFELTGDDGLVRRGILSLPQGHDASARSAVILLPAGLKYHVGPHGLNVQLARSLAAAGHLVLRFDPLGMGESDGALPAAPLADLWHAIGKGLFVDDALLAGQALRARHGVRSVVMGGVCGGALTGQLAAWRDPDAVQGVLSFGTSVSLPPISGEASAGMAYDVARQHTRSYLKKLTSKDAWLRVAKGETDFRGLFGVLGTTARGWMQPAQPADQPIPDENPYFMESFRNLQQRGISHLMVFGGSDNLWLEFESGVLGPRLGGKYRDGHYEIHVIEQANHELQFQDWSRQAVDLTRTWMARFLG